MWVKACSLLSVDSLRHQAWSRPAGDSSAPVPPPMSRNQKSASSRIERLKGSCKIAETSHRGSQRKILLMSCLRGVGSHGGSKISPAGIGMPAVVKLKDRDTDPIKRLLAIAADLVRRKRSRNEWSQAGRCYLKAILKSEKDASEARARGREGDGW